MYFYLVASWVSVATSLFSPYGHWPAEYLLLTHYFPTGFQLGISWSHTISPGEQLSIIYHSLFHLVAIWESVEHSLFSPGGQLSICMLNTHYFHLVASWVSVEHSLFPQVASWVSVANSLFSPGVQLSICWYLIISTWWPLSICWLLMISTWWPAEYLLTPHNFNLVACWVSVACSLFLPGGHLGICC